MAQAILANNLVVVFLGGELSLPRNFNLLHQATTLIGVDGGTKHIYTLGLKPTIALGDFDSLSPAELERARNDGTQIRHQPPSLNQMQTDFELAISTASELNPDGIAILGGLGGRQDQQLGNLMLATSAKYAHMNLTFYSATSIIAPVHSGPPRTFSTHQNDLVSLIPISDTVSGVTLAGTRWPLNNATLTRGHTLTISNRAAGGAVTASCEQGVMFFCQELAQ